MSVTLEKLHYIWQATFDTMYYIELNLLQYNERVNESLGVPMAGEPKRQRTWHTQQKNRFALLFASTIILILNNIYFVLFRASNNGQNSIEKNERESKTTINWRNCPIEEIDDGTMMSTIFPSIVRCCSFDFNFFTSHFQRQRGDMSP